MRIVFTISQLSGGGAERVVALLSDEMAKKGNEVSIITLLECPVVYAINPSVEHICLKCTKSRFIGTLKQIIALRNVYKRINPDIIISFLPVVNMTAIIANLGLGYRLIVSERNDPNKNPRKKSIRKLRNIIYKKASGGVFQTPDALKYFQNYCPNGIVIPNPVSSSLPSPYKGNREHRFVTAVRLEPQKNLYLMLNAFFRFLIENPEYTLEIYGEGSLHNDINDWIVNHQLQNHVFVRGFDSKWHEKAVNAKAFILSSDYEGMSNSLIEALAMGIPVISTDHPIGGARMFIEDGVNGYLSKVNDVESMISCMKKITRNTSIEQESERNSDSIRNSLSIAHITNKWIDFINEVYSE